MAEVLAIRSIRWAVVMSPFCPIHFFQIIFIRNQAMFKNEIKELHFASLRDFTETLEVKALNETVITQWEVDSKSHLNRVH